MQYELERTEAEVKGQAWYFTTSLFLLIENFYVYITCFIYTIYFSYSKTCVYIEVIYI